LPHQMKEFLEEFPRQADVASRVEENITRKRIALEPLKKVRLASPVPEPGSLRDGYAFRQHVEASRRNRGLEMIPEFDQFPIFYFGNHRTVFGEGPIAVEAD